MTKACKYCRTKFEITEQEDTFCSLNHRIKSQDYAKQYYQDHKCQIKLRSKKYAQTHKKYLKEWKRNHFQANKEKIYIAKQKYLHSCINARLAMNIRGRIIKALQRNSKKSSSIKLLGCSIEFLKCYLEHQFKPGMNWSNYGQFGWHVDHIKQCFKFDLSKKSEQYKCFHYTNLRPLWAEANYKRPKMYGKRRIVWIIK